MPSDSKAELLEILNIALDRFEEGTDLLYNEDNGVMECAVESGNKNIEIVETDKEITISLYNLDRRWVKLKGD